METEKQFKTGSNIGLILAEQENKQKYNLRFCPVSKVNIYLRTICQRTKIGTSPFRRKDFQTFSFSCWTRLRPFVKLTI